MHVSRFSNDMSSDQTHSNQYAANTESEQSFAERQATEKNRQTIAAYRFSRIGQTYAPRDRKLKVQSRQASTEQQVDARQSQALPRRMERSFQEPPTRKYNPYS